MAIAVKTITYQNSWIAKFRVLNQSRNNRIFSQISALLFNDRKQEGAVTVKVKGELSVLKYHTMKTRGEVEVKPHTFKT
jgi:hypothetical protein